MPLSFGEALEKVINLRYNTYVQKKGLIQPLLLLDHILPGSECEYHFVVFDLEIIAFFKINSVDLYYKTSILRQRHRHNG